MGPPAGQMAATAEDCPVPCQAQSKRLLSNERLCLPGPPDYFLYDKIFTGWISSTVRFRSSKLQEIVHGVNVSTMARARRGLLFPLLENQYTGIIPWRYYQTHILCHPRASSVRWTGGIPAASAGPDDWLACLRMEGTPRFADICTGNVRSDFVARKDKGAPTVPKDHSGCPALQNWLGG